MSARLEKWEFQTAFSPDPRLYRRSDKPASPSPRRFSLRRAAMLRKVFETYYEHLKVQPAAS